MENSIESIKTQYNKIVFRSTLEAKWAVFFDQLNLHWSYEPKKFALDNGSTYTPDFFVKGFGWIEIKPSLQELLTKIDKYCGFKETHCVPNNEDFFAFCSPNVEDHPQNSILEFENEGNYISGFKFAHCPNCDKYIFELFHDGFFYSRHCEHKRSRNDLRQDRQCIENAFDVSNKVQILDSFGGHNRIIVPIPIQHAH